MKGHILSLFCYIVLLCCIVILTVAIHTLCIEKYENFPQEHIATTDKAIIETRPGNILTSGSSFGSFCT